MPLDSLTVDHIHAKLYTRYASRWLMQYEGNDVELVKADWAEVLHGISDRSIRYALAHLPADYPPNAAQFLALCLQVPERKPQQRPLLEGPPADLTRLGKAMQRLVELQRARKPLQWAYDLKAAEESGTRMSEALRKAWRNALAKRGPEEGVNYGEFRPIEFYALPPGMKADLGKRS